MKLQFNSPILARRPIRWNKVGNPGRKRDDDEELGGGEDPEPRNRTELYKMFNSKGPTNMVCGFMSDSMLKMYAKLIIGVSGPLEESYYETLKQVSLGWDSQSKWVSERAVGSWMHTVPTPGNRQRFCLYLPGPNISQTKELCYVVKF